ncbi:P-loop containing nucleoside triphosphate hydrolase protein [Hyaloraphidium curvatum]|nr:P-loop containing nucleoside triphosphate hydrolase protein [Hyaloraphidium curvatum]
MSYGATTEMGAQDVAGAPPQKRWLSKRLSMLFPSQATLPGDSSQRSLQRLPSVPAIQSRAAVAPAPREERAAGVSPADMFAASLGLKQVHERKVVVIGSAGAGKTTLLSVYVTGKQPESYIPTIFETTNTRVDIDGHQIKVSLWDTAGQEEYARIRALCYSNASVILCCFPVNNKDAYREAEFHWIPEARHFCPDTPIILVGTKADTRQPRSEENDAADAQSISSDDSSVFVHFDEGSAMRDRLGLHSYMECSSSTGFHVRELFDGAIRASLVGPAVDGFSSRSAPGSPVKGGRKKARDCKIL